MRSHAGGIGFTDIILLEYSFAEYEGQPYSGRTSIGSEDGMYMDRFQKVCTAWTGSDVPRIERREHGAETGLRRIDREREAVHPHGTLAERKRRLDEALDDALAQTFPASDPIALLISP